MKNLLLIISLLLIFTLNGFSQFDATIKLYVEDSIGLKDSVWLGINNNSTLGIDSSLGEKNIFGTPFKDLDIRLIQRDSASFNCLYPFGTGNSSPIFFPLNIDSKSDFRPGWGNNANCKWQNLQKRDL